MPDGASGYQHAATARIHTRMRQLRARLVALALLASIWSCGGDVYPIKERRRTRAAKCLDYAKEELKTLAYGGGFQSVSIAYQDWSSSRLELHHSNRPQRVRCAGGSQPRAPRPAPARTAHLPFPVCPMCARSRFPLSVTSEIAYILLSEVMGYKSHLLDTATLFDQHPVRGVSYRRRD